MDKDLVLKSAFDKYRMIQAKSLSRDRGVLDLELHVKAHEILRELFKDLRITDDKHIEIDDFMFLEGRN